MLANRVAWMLYNNNLIEKKELPIYVYGFSLMLNSAFQIAILLTLGTVFCVIEETVVFLFEFIVARRFLGGYHAKTRACCMLFAIFTWIIALNFNLFSIMKKEFAVSMIFVLSLSVIDKYAPVNNYKKPLNKCQIIQNRRKGKYIVCLCILIIAILLNTRVKIAETMLGTLIMVDFYILVGRRSNAKEKVM